MHLLKVEYQAINSLHVLRRLCSGLRDIMSGLPTIIFLSRECTRLVSKLDMQADVNIWLE